MTRVENATGDSLKWLVERSGCLLTPHLRGLAAVDDSGRIRGVVGFDNWRPNAVDMHLAVESVGAGRVLLRAAFQMAFVELDLLVVTGRIRSDNYRALRLAHHLGFRECYRSRDEWARGVDSVHLEMRHESCRFLASQQTRKAA